MGLPLRVWVEKTIHGVEIHQLYSTEKVLSAGVKQGGDADSVQGLENLY